MNNEQELIETHEPQLTWETTSDHYDGNRLMSRALMLDKGQVMVNDLTELCASRGVFAWGVG